MLCVIETHPIQYHAPVWRSVQQEFGIPVTVLYGSDFSVAGYKDSEFNTSFAWDVDLLFGYQSIFLSRVAEGGAKTLEEIHMRGLEAELKKLNPSAILCVGYSPNYYYQSLKIAFSRNTPVLFRGETTDHAQKRSFVKNFLRNFLLKRIYKKCSALLPVGELSKKHYERLGFHTNKRYFSPYCVDNTVFQTDLNKKSLLRLKVRIELGISEHDLVVLFCGKLSHRKGPDLLLDAVEKLKITIGLEIICLFVGDGLMRNELKIQGEKNGIKTVFVGFQAQKELSRFYHASDIFILPSRVGETWGLVVNEALAHGIPCLVSRAVGCAPDLVHSGITGEVFNTDCLEDLAKSLVKVIELSKKESVIKNCTEMVAKYSVYQAALGIANAYSDISAQP